MDAYIMHSVSGYLNLLPLTIHMLILSSSNFCCIMQLNHVLKTRNLVTKNDAKLAKRQEGAKELLAGDTFLDHGFTRPKVMSSVYFLDLL